MTLDSDSDISTNFLAYVNTFGCPNIVPHANKDALCITTCPLCSGSCSNPINWRALQTRGLTYIFKSIQYLNYEDVHMSNSYLFIKQNYLKISNQLRMIRNHRINLPKMLKYSRPNSRIRFTFQKKPCSSQCIRDFAVTLN